MSELDGIEKDDTQHVTTHFLSSSTADMLPLWPLLRVNEKAV